VVQPVREHLLKHLPVVDYLLKWMPEQVLKLVGVVELLLKHLLVLDYMHSAQILEQVPQKSFHIPVSVCNF
jgi:hypothetical protein